LVLDLATIVCSPTHQNRPATGECTGRAKQVNSSGSPAHVRLAATNALSDIHSYQRGNDFTPAQREHDRDEIPRSVTTKRPGAVLWIYCVPPGVPPGLPALP
jgi:hypothetical protein